jgi:cellulose synthase/poly-beta-1,6-N-acetylglucosamine synthase-like glycosyltransferase
MQALLWYLTTKSHFDLVSPLAVPVLIGFFLYRIHYILVAARHLLLRIAHGTAEPMPAPGERPAAIVTLPTMLRSKGDLEGLKDAIRSCATNDYPGDLHIIAAIDDGVTRAALFEELRAWVSTLEVAPGVRVYACCTKVRKGKAVAIDEAVVFLQKRIADGLLAELPPIFFNMDADSELAPHTLTRMVDALLRRPRWTDQRRAIVTANVCIARDVYWTGWRDYFTMRGQISLHVAAEYLVSISMGRFNCKIAPVSGVSGALYCTWSELHVAAPKWAAFMQTITIRDWLGWLIGSAPPRLDACRAEDLPEATTGPGDDTWVTWLSFCARWTSGKLTLELPRTPAHAFFYLVRSYFFRALAFDPAARVYTKTPTTVRALFKQRIRWNTSRISVIHRWMPGLAFHWTAGFPAVLSGWIILYCNAAVTVSLLKLPFEKAVSPPAFLFLFAFLMALRAFYALIALALEGGLRTDAPKLLGVLFAVPYHLVFNKLTTMLGYVQDILLFGVNTHFAPEETFIKGHLPRIALAYRLRRAFVLAVRAVIHNDVPLGWFWFGWHETKWTPSGYDGWTSGKGRRVMYARTPAAAPVAAPALAPAAIVIAAPVPVTVAEPVTAMAAAAVVAERVAMAEPVAARSVPLSIRPTLARRSITLAPTSSRDRAPNSSRDHSPNSSRDRDRRAA